MPASVLLFTDRPGCEPIWRPACEQLGLQVKTLGPEDLARSARSGLGVIIDGASSAYDEDELLASVGFARARGAITAAQVPSDDSMAALDEVLGELCPGLVAHSEEDVARVALLLVRRLDAARARRFEFVTVSPRDGELLAILGDGRSLLLERPVTDGDDGSEVVSIELAEDALSATVELANGARVRIDARSLRNGAKPAAGIAESGAAAEGNGTPIEGARLGARLRELRLAAGLTQAELARRTGIHRPNIARVEAGRHTPSLETLARLATAIGVPTTRVLSED